MQFVTSVARQASPIARGTHRIDTTEPLDIQGGEESLRHEISGMKVRFALVVYCAPCCFLEFSCAIVPNVGGANDSSAGKDCPRRLCTFFDEIVILFGISHQVV